MKPHRIDNTAVSPTGVVVWAVSDYWRGMDIYSYPDGMTATPQNTLTRTTEQHLKSAIKAIESLGKSIGKWKFDSIKKS